MAQCTFVKFADGRQSGCECCEFCSIDEVVQLQTKKTQKLSQNGTQQQQQLVVCIYFVATSIEIKTFSLGQLTIHPHPVPLLEPTAVPSVVTSIHSFGEGT